MLFAGAIKAATKKCKDSKGLNVSITRPFLRRTSVSISSHGSSYLLVLLSSLSLATNFAFSLEGKLFHFVLIFVSSFNYD